MDIFWLVLRIFCLAGCLCSLWILGSAHYRQWRKWNSKTKFHWFALSGWVFSGIYSVSENLILDISGGSRTIVMSLVVLFTLRALLDNEELKAEPTIPWKGKNKHETE